MDETIRWRIDMKITSKIITWFFKSKFFCFRQLRKIGIKIKMSNQEKASIISELFLTDEGRTILANAMVEPVTCRMPKYAYTDEELANGNFSWDKEKK